MIDIIDPVLPFVVSAEGLRISKRFPFSVDAPPGRVTFYLFQGHVRRHNLCYVVRIPTTMNAKQPPPQILNERLDRAQFLPFHVFINLSTGDLLWPLPAFLDQKLAEYSVGVKSRYTCRDAESAVPRYNLPRLMNWLRRGVGRPSCCILSSPTY
jgi:hypothetical protein